MATGGAMTYISHDPVPVVASGIICGVFIFGYEYMICHPSTGDGAPKPQVSKETSQVPLYVFDVAELWAA
jgi:hypothetical protein